jgi:hypothetical protein
MWVQDIILCRVLNYHDSHTLDQERSRILFRLVGVGFDIGWYGFVFGLRPFLLWSGKVVRQPLFSRLLGNHCSQDCKAIIFLVSGKIVRQSFGSSGLLDPVPFNVLIVGLGFCIIKSHSN